MRLHQRIIFVGFGWIDIGIGRHNIVVPRQDDGRIEGAKLGGVRNQTFHPCQLVLELWPRLWIAVRRIERGDQHAVDGALNVAALGIGRITRQRGVRGHRLATPRKDGDAVQ